MKASKKWLKELKNIIQRSFKKVRIKTGKKETNDVSDKIKLKHKMKNDLGNLKEYLKNGENTATNSKKKHELEDKIEEIEESIANATAKKHAEVIMEHFQELTDENEEFSNNKMWSLKKKLCDKNRELPMAMVDSGGNMISGKNSLKLLYKTTYEERLKHKPIEEGWEEIKKLKDELFEERIKISEKNKSEDWKLSKV